MSVNLKNHQCSHTLSNLNQWISYITSESQMYLATLLIMPSVGSDMTWISLINSKKKRKKEKKGL